MFNEAPESVTFLLYTFLKSGHFLKAAGRELFRYTFFLLLFILQTSRQQKHKE